MIFKQHGPQDYRCPSCGHIERDIRADWVPVPEDRRLYKGQEEKRLVPCPQLSCRSVGFVGPDGIGTRVAMEWIPRPTANDLTSGGTGLYVDLGDPTGPRRFDSFHEMHQHAAESQRRAANGDGPAVSFRALHQSAGNMDRNTLHGSSFEKNRQVPHRDLGKTAAGRRIDGRAVREQDFRR